MQEEMIRTLSQLMAEQSAAYRSLESVTSQLAVALTRGEPSVIDPLTHAGEKELARMRARLLEITTRLTDFSRLRAQDKSGEPIGADIRDQFEQSSAELTERARSFAAVAARASMLAVSGSTFASMSIQASGVPAMTYKAPVIRNGGAAR
jgi:uncharacterized coiled-coil protein SlyX